MSQLFEVTEVLVSDHELWARKALVGVQIEPLSQECVDCFHLMESSYAGKGVHVVQTSVVTRTLRNMGRVQAAEYWERRCPHIVLFRFSPDCCTAIP